MTSSFLDKLRFKMFLAGKGLSFLDNNLRMIYKWYLNHDKIIHYRNGYPVFSMFSPAIYSKPSSNFLSRIVFKSIQNKNLPNMMTFAVNAICDAECQHCSFYEAIEDRSKKELSTEEMKKLIRDAQDLGVSVLNFVGGEPLLKKDLADLVGSVNKDLSTVILFTNGSLLKQKVKDLKKAGLDGVYVSIDYADEKLHDEFRKKKGLYQAAMEGIKEALKSGVTVGISCTLNEERFKAGEFERIAELAKKMKVHEVIVFEDFPSGRNKQSYTFGKTSWKDELIHESRKFNNDKSYPGFLIVPYLTSYQSSGCSCGTAYFYVSPYGDFHSCDFNSRIFGNVKEEKLYQIWDRVSSTDGYTCAKWGGCKITDPLFHQEVKPNHIHTTV